MIDEFAEYKEISSGRDTIYTCDECGVNESFNWNEETGCYESAYNRIFRFGEEDLCEYCLRDKIK